MGIKIIDKTAKYRVNRVRLIGKDFDQRQEYTLLLNIKTKSRLVKIYV